MPTSVQVILDAWDLLDTSTNAPSILAAGGLSDYFGVQYNTASYTVYPGPSDPPWILNIPVQGVSVVLYGISPPATDPIYNQTILVLDPTDPKGLSDPNSLDGYSSHTYTAPALGGQLFATANRLQTAQSLVLSLRQIYGMTLHYAVVEVGEFTSLTGRKLVVDDSSDEVAWSDGWGTKRDETLLVAGNISDHLPEAKETAFKAAFAAHGNSTRVSSTPGEYFVFPFTGTFVSVYGIFPGKHLPNTPELRLQMVFSIDSTVNTTATFNATASAPPTGDFGPDYVYFTADGLAPTSHTLRGTIISCISPDGAAKIDFITYKPSFGTAHDKPAVQIGGGESSDNGATVPDGGKAPVAAIAGGVAGGVVLFLLLAVSLLLLLRKRAERRRNQGPRDLLDEERDPSPEKLPTDPLLVTPKVEPFGTDTALSASGTGYGSELHTTLFRTTAATLAYAAGLRGLHMKSRRTRLGEYVGLEDLDARAASGTSRATAAPFSPRIRAQDWPTHTVNMLSSLAQSPRQPHHY
ncbi:hypothetical protein MKEN_00961200 [Mycena kentingensis (nom. inval.)]|nr:hypothetical protein MKEN_00961200 [Mycena kentingensis (nom. inval.)]